ncbi:sensor histidine kinase [Streptomyces sp. Ru73]|uniref:sensor histidine kinase n=1 Tax=Streptomyces sp. Ru73 TaxID=2080748 RepID=UPI0021564412|nr:histidine kinase [Streptomyces sp. Ru73]
MSPSAAPVRPHRDDVLIAASGLLGGVLLWFLGLHGGPPLFGLPAQLALLALAAMSGAELLRRTAPGTALAVGVAAMVLDVLTGTVIATVLMFTDVIYAAVMYGSPAAARRIPRACVLVTVLATLLPVALLRDPQALLIGVAVGVGTIGPAWTAVLIRGHREAAQAARLRAEQTALLAELDRREAVLAERARMARELHDMVAGHLSAIAIHATAAQSLDDPAATGDALGVIRENSVQGLAEMRRLIGLLRDAGAAEAPAATPSLEALDALLERARGHGAGSGLTFTLADERPPGGPPLAAPVELAAYRIVQESVTNALKHAAPGEVTVRLARADGALSLTVTSPYGRRPGPRAPGSGSGLVGMRERAALLRGTFDAAPDGDVWRVRATLPADDEKEHPR